MTALTTGDFHRAMADHRAAVVVFAGCAANGAAALAALSGPEAASGPWFRAWVDVEASPGIAAMFGIAGDLPVVLVMREEVVLFCAPFDPADPGPARAIIERAAKLDMARVQREIAQEREKERESQAALFARRVCPTAWR